MKSPTVRVQLITNYWHFPHEKASSRYSTLASMLVEAGAEVEVVTSTFYHFSKTHRSPVPNTMSGERFAVTLLPEPGYTKNISLRRIYSHHKLAHETAGYLRGSRKPDVVVAAVPSLDLAQQASRHARRLGVPLVIDVQDLWPEAFRIGVSLPGLNTTLYRPLTRKADAIYRSADVITAVSATYLARARTVNERAPGEVVYIGIDLDAFDAARTHGCDSPRLHRVGPNFTDGPVLAYIGTLGHSYDLPTAFRATLEVERRLGSPIRLLVMGDGPLRDTYETQAKSLGIRAEFTGQLPYSEMVRRLSEAALALNPIHGRSAASIINKHGDYLAAGLPIVNSQQSAELQDLLRDSGAGFSSAPGDVTAFADAIESILADPLRHSGMSIAARRLAETRFDRRRTYPAMVESILGAVR